MQAIILGAGRGTRLGDKNPGLPKLLLPVGGERLVDRQRSLIAEALPEVEQTTIVIGYKAAYVRELAGPDVRYVTNPDFMSTNTAASLRLAFQADGSDALVINGDVFCDLAAIEAVRELWNGAVVEFKPYVDPEEVQVCLDDGGRVSRIGKDIGGCGEAFGIYRVSAEFIQRYLDRYTDEFANRYYEDVFNRLIDEQGARFDAVSLGDGWAIEIDTPSDLARAQLMTLERAA